MSGPPDLSLTMSPTLNVVCFGICYVFLQNVRVLANPLAGVSVDCGVDVETTWKYREQRG
jgi:hypothetical protein